MTFWSSDIDLEKQLLWHDDEHIQLLTYSTFTVIKTTFNHINHIIVIKKIIIVLFKWRSPHWWDYWKSILAILPNSPPTNSLEYL